MQYIHIKVVLVTQSCPTLCDSMYCSLPGNFVHGILQARILEWVAIPFSRGSFQFRNPTYNGVLFSCNKEQSSGKCNNMDET